MTRENWSIEDYRQAMDAAERERDEAQEHVAYHLRDYALNSEPTGDLAVDMARFAGRLRVRAEAAEQRLAAVRALADEWEADYPSDLAACDYAPDKWWRDLRAALGDADGGGDR